MVYFSQQHFRRSVGAGRPERTPAHTNSISLRLPLSEGITKETISPNLGPCWAPPTILSVLSFMVSFIVPGLCSDKVQLNAS